MEVKASIGANTQYTSVEKIVNKQQLVHGLQIMKLVQLLVQTSVLHKSVFYAIFSHPERRMSLETASISEMKSFLLLVVIFATSGPCHGQGDYIVIV